MALSGTLHQSAASESPEYIIEKGLGRDLAHSTEKSIRDAGMEKFYSLLQTRAEKWGDLEFLQCWKGLYFAYWMSDKQLVQQELANNLAAAIHELKDQVALKYLEAFWTILSSEWHNLDRIRLNKYYFLIRRIHVHTFTWLSYRNWDLEKVDQVIQVLQNGPLSFNSMKIPNSLRYHTIEVFFTHLADACSLPDADPITLAAMTKIIEPFMHWLKSSDNPNIVSHIFTDILDLYKTSSEDVEEEESTSASYLAKIYSAQDMAMLLYCIPSDQTARSKNKKMVEEYLNDWSIAVGIPFTPSMTITGLNIRKIDLQFDPKTIVSSSATPTRPSKISPAPKIVECKNKASPLNAKREHAAIDKEEDLAKKLESKTDNDVSIGEADVAVETVQEEKAIDGQPAKKKKKRSKKKKNNGLSESEKHHEALLEQLAQQSEQNEAVDDSKEEETLIQEVDCVPESSTGAKKSVSWGPKKIKPFKKNSIICSNEEAQKVPLVTSAAPKVLKAYEKGQILLHTAGSRKSKRNRNSA